MQTLTWTKIAAGHHELRAIDGTLWADVVPRVGEFSRKGSMQGTVRLPDFHMRGGVEWWVVGTNTGAAKRFVEAWMRRNACAAENFQIVEACVTRVAA